MQAFDWHRMALRVTVLNSRDSSGWLFRKPTGKSVSTMIGPGRQSRSGHFPTAPQRELVTLVRDDEYAGVGCSAVLKLCAGDKQLSPRCANAEWSRASRAKNVT